MITTFWLVYSNNTYQDNKYIINWVKPKQILGDKRPEHMWLHPLSRGARLVHVIQLHIVIVFVQLLFPRQQIFS